MYTLMFSLLSWLSFQPNSSVPGDGRHSHSGFNISQTESLALPHTGSESSPDLVYLLTYSSSFLKCPLLTESATSAWESGLKADEWCHEEKSFKNVPLSGQSTRNCDVEFELFGPGVGIHRDIMMKTKLPLQREEKYFWLFVRWRCFYSNCCHCHLQTPSKWTRALADMLCKLKIDAAPAF